MSKLREIRKSKRVSITGLSRLAGVPVRAIESYEYGQNLIDNAHLENICRLAIALECTVDDLLEDEGLLEMFRVAAGKEVQANEPARRT